MDSPTTRASLDGESQSDVAKDKQNHQVYVDDLSSATEKDGDFEKLDRAAAYVADYRSQHGEIPLLTEKEERSMVRRFDLILVPLLLVTTMMGALDKVSVGQAAIYGMTADTHLVGQNYSWISSGIYFGTIAGALPQIYFMKKFTTSKFIAVNVTIWGLLTMCMAACTSFRSLMALRVLLGLFEAIVNSGSLLILSGFYKRTEQPSRTAFCFSTFSSIFNGLLGYGSSFAPTDGFAPWKIVFLASGAFTAFWGILDFFVLPSTVMDPVWMKSPKRRVQALERVKGENLGTENHVIKWDQVKETFMDPKTYFIFVISLLNNIPNGGLIGFNSIVIKSFGYTSRITSLLTIPTGIISFLASLFFSWVAGYTTNYRSIVAAVSVLPPMIGVILLHTLPLTNTHGRLGAIYVLYTYWSPYILGQALMLNNTAGLTKKTVVYAVNYIGYSVGNLIGPQIFLAKEAPGYKTAVTTMLCCYAIDGCLFIAYGLWCRYLNRQKTRQREALHISQVEDKDIAVEKSDALHDLTDLKNPHFVYMT